MDTRSINLSLGIIAMTCGIGALYFLAPVLIPLVLAFVLAILVNSLVRFIGDRWRAAPRWAVLVLAALVVTLGTAIAFVILAQGAANVVREMPQLIGRIDTLLRQTGPALHLRKPPDLASIVGEISVPSIAAGVAGSVGHLFSGLVLMIAYFGFILAGRTRATRKLASLSALSGAKIPIEAAVNHISTGVELYVWVHTVTGLIIAGASALVMFAVGLDNALFWSILLFLLCYIPIIGVTVGSIVPALFALGQFPGWWQSAVIFGGIQVAAGLVGNLIFPRLQAATQNIDPVATLFALAFWGFLWGLTGAFLAIPLTMIVMMVCAYFPQTRWLAILLSNDADPLFPGLSADEE